MARFLALDWDHQQLQVVAATVKQGVVRVQKAVAWEEGQNPHSAGASALGAALRERLKAAGIAPAPVLACIGRDRLIVKDVRYPQVPATEEPAVVRFQVVKELTDSPDDAVIDYLPTGEASATGERRALALVVRKDVVNSYRELCRAAGLKLAALTPRPFGLIASLRRLVGTSVLTPAPEPADAAVAMIAVGKPWAEFIVVQGETLLLARSLTAGPLLAGEVRRNLALYAGRNAGRPIRAVYVADGSADATFRERLQEALGVPVYPFDPFGGAEGPELPAEHRGAFTAAAGLLQARADSRVLPINFLQPKEPRPVRDPNQKKLLTYAAVAGVLVLALVGFGYAKLADRDRQIAELLRTKDGLETDKARFKEDGERIKALDQWTQSDVVWLDELYDLVDRVPDLKKLRVARVSFSELPNRKAKDAHVGQVALNVVTTSEMATVNTLETWLFQDKHLRVYSKVPGRNRGGRVVQFPSQFTLKYDLEKLPPTKFEHRPLEDVDDTYSKAKRKGGPPGRGRAPYGSGRLERRGP